MPNRLKMPKKRDEAPSEIEDSADDEQASEENDTDVSDDSADAGDSNDEPNSAE